jgi:hypothetical protein
MDLNLNLVDKVSIDNLIELERRDKHLRIVIDNKIYDTSHEDDIARYVINHTKYGNMLLIRYEYYLSKAYHGLGKGDMVFYDNTNNVLYVLELKSLKDKYSSITDSAKIEKCIAQSIKYSEYTLTWASKESIPVSVIELTDGKIQITERITLPAEKPKPNEQSNDLLNLSPQKIDQNPKISKYPWTNTIQKKEQEEINNDKWFSHPGDQTLTKYRINGDTLESERIVDYQPSSGSRRAFRKRVKRVCQESTKCTKYLIVLKDTQGAILMQELHEINETDVLD